MTSLNERLRQLRKQRGLTQEQLAQQVNVSRQTVFHWENGRASPDYAMLHLLAEALDTSVTALLGEETPAESEAGHADSIGNGGTEGSNADAAQRSPCEPQSPDEPFLPDPLPEATEQPPQRTMPRWLPWVAASVFLCLCLLAAFWLSSPRSIPADQLSAPTAPASTLTPAWFDSSSPRVEGQGWVDIVVYQSPVPRKETTGPYQWAHSVFFREENGVATTIDQLDLWYFFAEGHARQETHPGKEIDWKSYSNSTIRAGGSREFILSNASSQPILGVGFQLTCTDANGQKLVFRKFIPYSMETGT